MWRTTWWFGCNSNVHCTCWLDVQHSLSECSRVHSIAVCLCAKSMERHYLKSQSHEILSTTDSTKTEIKFTLISWYVVFRICSKHPYSFGVLQNFCTCIHSCIVLTRYWTSAGHNVYHVACCYFLKWKLASLQWERQRQSQYTKALENLATNPNKM